MNDGIWASFDGDLDVVLQSAVFGTVSGKPQVLSSIIYALGKERFGSEKRLDVKTAQEVPYKREWEIKKIRAELKILRHLYRRSDAVDREGLAQLRDQQRARLKFLNIAKRLRRKKGRQPGKEHLSSQIHISLQKAYLGRKVWSLGILKVISIKLENHRSPALVFTAGQQSHRDTHQLFG